MAPEVTVTIYTAPPEALVTLLAQSHMLYGLPLLHRLQFTKFPGGITEHTRILWASEISLEDHHLAATATTAAATTNGIVNGSGGSGSVNMGARTETPFAAAYLDLSRGPETELWIYSSMERRVGSSVSAGATEANGVGIELGGEVEDGEKKEGEEIAAIETACAIALLRAVRREQDIYFVPGSRRSLARAFPTILVGALNEVLRENLAAAGMAIVSTGLYDKWVFRVAELPADDEVPLPTPLEDGRCWVWDKVRKGDIPFMISRTEIHRTERTMKLLPSTALYLDDGTPVAWAFLGPDSSLSSLHCEEPYRGKGIAKAVAVKLLKDHLKDYSDDGYGWADVAPDNLGSRRVCQSLNGRVEWQISWSRLNLNESFPNE
ncbi:hypothetical protein F4777DRAFT_348512 [Nemania sp. FL0916]|nr:hypothetical protein F4777DRAFT_348512 [Nemania sp. FL0916]